MRFSIHRLRQTIFTIAAKEITIFRWRAWSLLNFTSFGDKIVVMCARGMTVREIQGFLAEQYGTEVSPDFIRSVTDAVMVEVIAWLSRPLELMYPVVRNKKAIYLALGLLPDGTRDILGLWVESTGGAKFWMKVFRAPVFWHLSIPSVGRRIGKNSEIFLKNLRKSSSVDVGKLLDIEVDIMDGLESSRNRVFFQSLVAEARKAQLAQTFSNGPLAHCMPACSRCCNRCLFRC